MSDARSGNERPLMATYAAPVPQIVAHKAKPEPQRLGELDHDDRPQADRDHVHGHDVRVLHPGRRRGLIDPPAAGLAQQHAGFPQIYNQLFTMHGTTMIFLFVVPMMAAGQLLRALDDRGAGHGLPAPERALLLALLGRWTVFYASIFWNPPKRAGRAMCRVGDRLLAGRRPGRVDLPDPPDRPLLDPRRDQLLRDDRQHARAGHELGPPAAVHLGDPDVFDPDDLRAACDRGGGRRCC